MQLIDVVKCSPAPQPWAEGDNIPWDEPGFSERMLKEHLPPNSHASRRFDIIDRHVAWIHQTVLSSRLTRVLDLGCGPGLYAMRLAGLGHDCIGIDFSPASIRYAREQTQQASLSCTFTHEDVRKAAFGTGFGLAMFIYGEFNVFKPNDVRTILAKIYGALLPGGQLLIELSTYDAIEAMGRQPPGWYSSPCGLDSERPHLAFQETAWDKETRTATTRHFVLDATTAQVTCYTATYQAYHEDEFADVLHECGFEGEQVFPSLLGVPDESQRTTAEMVAVVAKRPQR